MSKAGKSLKSAVRPGKSLESSVRPGISMKSVDRPGISLKSMIRPGNHSVGTCVLKVLETVVYEETKDQLSD